MTTNSRTGTHVRYTLTATAAVNGSVSATCQPRSGSLFRVGRTAVSCAGTDTSGNTANARFTVTVKRTRH